MTGTLTTETKLRLAREIVHDAIREQLERSVPTGCLGIDGPQTVAGEIMQTLLRPSLADPLLLLAAELHHLQAPPLRDGFLSLFTRRRRR
jgi:hypothetical protein